MTGEQKDWKSNAKRTAPRKEPKQRFNDAKFIQYELDEATQKACKNWEVSTSDLVDTLDRLVDDGYRVTVKWDSWSEAYSASLQQTMDDGKNPGYILVGRGSTGAKALKQVIFKHYTVMQEDWAEYAGFDRRAVIDD